LTVGIVRFIILCYIKKERKLTLSGKVEIKNKLRGLLDPLVALLSHLGISPLSVTIFGIVLSAVGAVFVAMGSLLWGAIVLVAAGICDTLDGSLARREGTESTFGAFIDSTGDRIAEILYYGALVFYFRGAELFNNVAIFFVLVALAGSFLTSYARARAEGLGLECQVGLLERPERVALLVLGLLFGRIVLVIIIVVLAVFTVYTSAQRILHVKRLTAGDGKS
jgi:CDP-diacylglycerol--glycerol-3-phosphate 3-phosphatidyltransferase